MTAFTKENAARGADLGGIESDLPGGRIEDKDTPSGRRYHVEIVHPVTGKPQTWDSYSSREAADTVATTLRKHGLFAQVRVAEDQAPEAPEHNGERRRFLCWALMLGAIPPERLTERIVAEIESEAAI